MQTHDDFIFHLEEPREQFRKGPKRLRGWITAREPLRDLRLREASERILRTEERPDVRRAFPNFSTAIGFIDEVGACDLHHGELRFVFSVGGVARNVVEILAPAPAPPSFVARTVAKAQRALALLQLRFAPSWNVALRAFLLETKIARGNDFRREEADRLIALFAEIFPNAFVVQIGANDGLSGDPLAEAFLKTRWSGLLVEPVPHLYAALAVRYRERPEISLERAAISSRDGEAPLYRLREMPGETPAWFNQLATLDREVLLKHRDAIPNLESLIVEEATPTIRLETLFARHQVKHIDLFVIDTEGHDYEILREFDFAKFTPAVVMFEHQHLSPNEKLAAYALIRQHGYDFRETPEGDTVAWRML